MAESKLPPGPWTFAPVPGARTDDPGFRPVALLDATGRAIFTISDLEWINSPDEVLRAIEALPLLVAAARRIVDRNSTLRAHIEAIHALEDALALIDGKEG